MKFPSNMTNRFFTIVFMLTASHFYAQESNLTYFDENWDKTKKENASYYRISPSKTLKDLMLLEDFYISKAPQFQGYTLKSDENDYVGDIVWYDAKGFDLSFYQYYNNTAVPFLTYYYPNGKKRKTITYKNGRKNGETIVYHQDGTILIKGIYQDGKPVSGSFEDINDWDYYRTNKADRNRKEQGDDPVITAYPVVEESNAVVGPKGKKTVERKLISVKTFWINSKQLAQETTYNVKEYVMNPVKKVNYDAAGKLVQTLNENDFETYGKNFFSGIGFQYYLQNNFAVAIKSKTSYKKGIKSGEEIKYHSNGKVAETTKFINGNIEGEQIAYTEKGTVIKKRIYKNGKPFDGNFDETLSGRLLANQNYIQGLKQGESIVKTDEDSLVAKGIYKDGKPFNGTFVEKKENDQNELIQVVNFKKNGLQKVFDSNIDNIIKTYYCKDDVLNGEMTFYDKGEVTGILEYKNGSPYNGELTESQKRTIFKNGEITEEVFYKNKYRSMSDENVHKQKQYTNGKLTKIIDKSFYIADIGGDVFEGIYKDEKPYQGYFATDFREFNYVEYYEKGEVKYQYSNNYLENMDKYDHPLYDIKSTYKDGKIFDGPEYIKIDHFFMTKYWTNGMLQRYDCDVFAVHYFNRIQFALKNNTIEINEFRKKKIGKITKEKVNNKEVSKLWIDEKVIMSSTSAEVSTVIPENAASIAYTEWNNKVDAKILNFDQNIADDREDSEIFYSIFTSNIDDRKTIVENFNSIANNFSTGKNVESIFGKHRENSMIAGIYFNEAGKPDSGVLIVKNKENQYDLQAFLYGKMLEEIKNIDLKNMKKTVEKLNDAITKKLNERD